MLKKVLIGLSLFITLAATPVLAAKVAGSVADAAPCFVDASTGGLWSLMEFETRRVEPGAMTVWLSSAGYFAGAICTPTAAGNVKFYDINTATTTGATLILEFGLPNVASQPFAITFPGNAIVKVDTGLVASATTGVMCYGLFIDS